MMNFDLFNRFLWRNRRMEERILLGICISDIMLFMVLSQWLSFFTQTQIDSIHANAKERRTESCFDYCFVCVNLCNRILNWSSILFFFVLDFFEFFFYRSIRSVAAASPSMPFCSSRSVSFLWIRNFTFCWWLRNF